MTRLDKLEALRANPMLAKDFKRLKASDLAEVIDFIRSNEALGDDAFMAAANRWKLDQPRNAKVYAIQWSLIISTVDTVANMRRRKQNGKAD